MPRCACWTVVAFVEWSADESPQISAMYSGPLRPYVQTSISPWPPIIMASPTPAMQEGTPLQPGPGPGIRPPLRLTSLDSAAQISPHPLRTRRTTLLSTSPQLYLARSGLMTGSLSLPGRRASAHRVRPPSTLFPSIPTLLMLNPAFPPSQRGFYVTTPAAYKDFAVSDLPRRHPL